MRLSIRFNLVIDGACHQSDFRAPRMTKWHFRREFLQINVMILHPFGFFWLGLPRPTPMIPDLSAHQSCFIALFYLTIWEMRADAGSHSQRQEMIERHQCGRSSQKKYPVDVATARIVTFMMRSCDRRCFRAA
jgi:hypothetical protein